MDRNPNNKIRQQYHQRWLQYTVSHNTSNNDNTSTNSTFQQRPNPVNRPSHRGFTSQTGNRASLRRRSSTDTGLLQLAVRHPQERWGHSSCVQPQTAQSISGCTSFQDGDHQRSYTHDTEERLLTFHRPVRCFFTYSSSSRIPSLSSAEMEIPSLPVLHSCLWPGYSTIRLYQNMPPYPRMGSLSGNNTYLSLSGRLDFDSQNKGTSTSARPASRTIATKPGMDCQLQEISPETNSTTGTSRLLLEYKNTASISPDEEVTGPTSLNRTNSGPSSQTDSPCTSQCHYAYSGSNLCDISSSSLHSPPTILQESGCEVGQGLGLTNNAGSRQYRRTSTVVYQSEEVERPLFSPHDTHRDHIRGCQQHRVGMQLDEPHCCSRLLDSRRGESVDQLARTSSSVLCPENLQRTSQLEHTNPNGQHHQPLLYQQAGWYSLPSYDGSSNAGLELVSRTQHNNTGATYPGHTQHEGRYGITPDVLQESMANSPFNLPTNQSTVGPILDRPLCSRPNDQAVAKIRVLATESGRYVYGCLYDSMDQLDETVCESPMESDFSCSTQDCTGETSLNLPGSSLLAERHMVPSGTTSGSSLPTFDAITTNDSNDVSQNASSPSSSELDTLRVAIIHNKFVKAKNLQEQAIADLMAQKLAKNGTNRLYRKNQLRFLAWAVENGVSYTTFSGADCLE